MRILLVVSFLALAFSAVASLASAQNGAGSQDSLVVGTLRPRWGTYLIPVFPSPARAGQSITIQFYNHNEDIIACKIFDAVNREVIVLQPKQTVASGLHTFTIGPKILAAGMYFVRLVDYTASGSQNLVDITRFVIIH